jgi:hypothetical protein
VTKAASAARYRCATAPIRTRTDNAMMGVFWSRIQVDLLDRRCCFHQTQGVSLHRSDQGMPHQADKSPAAVAGVSRYTNPPPNGYPRKSRRSSC